MPSIFIILCIVACVFWFWAYLRKRREQQLHHTRTSQPPNDLEAGITLDTNVVRASAPSSPQLEYGVSRPSVVLVSATVLFASLISHTVIFISVDCTQDVGQ